MTRSIPGISSDGKMSPASTMMISFPYSNAVMFLPISPTPPKNLIFRLFALDFAAFSRKGITSLLGALFLRAEIFGASARAFFDGSFLSAFGARALRCFCSFAPGAICRALAPSLTVNAAFGAGFCSFNISCGIMCPPALFVSLFCPLFIFIIPLFSHTLQNIILHHFSEIVNALPA